MRTMVQYSRHRMPASSRASKAHADPNLAVAGLESFFGEEPSSCEATPPSPQVVADQPVVSMIHDFVTDFQKLAIEWQSD